MNVLINRPAIQRCLTIALALTALLGLQACAQHGTPTTAVAQVFLAGDSTVTDQQQNADYWTHRHPVTGWGQAFEPYVNGDNLAQLGHLLNADSSVVVNRARGGRSTRTFFEEGRWDEIYRALKPGDLVLIQFGHNDAAVDKPERYVTVAGYQQYLRLYVQQTREKGATPILITPVARNYPWVEGELRNEHGDYPQAMKAVAAELDVQLIDLLELSKAYFTRKGQAYVSSQYFMNLPAGKFPAYPNGQNDNTHFQPEGAEAVARLVFEGLKALQ